MLDTEKLHFMLLSEKTTDAHIFGLGVTAGYKNFFSKYDSQKFCKKNQKRLRIKIIAQKELFFVMDVIK